MNARRFFSVPIVAVGLLLGAAPALAQVDTPPPPAFSTTDRNGVDMVSGTISIVLGSVSIGPQDGGLSNTITMTDGKLAGASINHSLVGGISEIHAGPTPLVRRYTVTFMGETTVFTRGRDSNTFVYREGRGGKLVLGGPGYVYTAPDGSIGQYSSALVSWNDNALANRASLVSVERPNGEVMTYHYVGTSNLDLRLQSVTNNRGYQIHFQHFPDSVEIAKVEAINNAVDPCAPTVNVCSYSRTWPSLTRNVYGQWVNALGESRRSSPARVIWPDPAYPSYTTQYIWGNSETAISEVFDGVGSWTYTFGEPPIPGGTPDTSVNQISSPAGTDQVTLYWSENNNHPTPQFEPNFRSITNGVGNTTYYGFRGNLITFIQRPESVPIPDPNFYNSEIWSYDPSGKLITWNARAKQGSGLADRSFTLTYADCSTPIRCQRPTAATDQRGNVTDFTYDAAGNLLTATAPAPTPGATRPQTRNSYVQQYAWYKQNGSASITQAATPIWVLSETSACTISASCNGAAEEVQTTLAYQAGSAGVASNLLPVSSTSGSGDGALAATTTTTWTPNGDPDTVDGPLPGNADVSRQLYDAARQMVGTIGPDPDGAGGRAYPAVRTTYNAQGQPTAVARGTTTGQSDAAWAAFTALQTDTTAYDTRGFKAQDTAAAGSANPSVTQYAYDAEGRLVCTAQRMNPAAYGSLPGACSLGTPGSFGPDRISHTTYDLADRPIEVRLGWGTPQVRLERVQAYTPDGLVDWVEDGMGNRSDYAYDGYNRLSVLSFPSATVGAHTANPADYEQYGYDAADNPVSKRVRSGETFTTSFDALDRITYVDAPAGANDLMFDYDLLGRRLTATQPSVQTITSTWDALGRNTSEAGVLGVVTNAYDLAGRRTQRTWPNGNWVTYAWNLDGGMTSAAVNGWLVAGAMTYDDLGRRTQTTRHNGVTTTYGYNTASQLTSLSHDLAGTVNDLSYTFIHTPAPQIATRTVSNSVYDYIPTSGTTSYANNGLNQTTSAGGVGVGWDGRGNLITDGGRNYTYDAANRLLTGGGSTLTYDPLDRLYEHTGTGGGRLLYDGAQLAGVFNGAGTMTEHWVGGPNPDEWLTFHEGVDWRWPLQDAQGSVVAVTDGSGNATATLAYDEYGQPRAGNAGRMQYTGQMVLLDAGLYHYKARGYHAGLGRFMQTDPVGYEQGLNLYAYVENDPVNATDPTGKIAQDPCNAFGCATPASPETRAAQQAFEAELARSEPVVRQQLLIAGGTIIAVGVTGGVAYEVGLPAVAAAASRGVPAAEANAAALARAAARPGPAAARPPPQIVRPGPAGNRASTGANSAEAAVPGSGTAPPARNLAGELVRATGELIEANQPLIKTIVDWFF